MERFKGLSISLLAVVVVACEPGGDQAVLARAAGYELTVNEAVSMLAGQVQLRNEPQVPRALGNLWVDYILIAEAARGDSTMSSIDVSPILEPEIEEMLIMALADSAIPVDTVISDDQLRARFQEEAPGVEVRARHILLGRPNQATPAQNDSVRAELAALRERILGGESFEELARIYSHDRGNAAQGGDFGFFSRNGDVVRPLEDAAFSMEIGELSGVIETVYGFHVLRLEERNEPSFEEIRDAYRAGIQARLIQEAQIAFVDSLIGQAEIEPSEDAGELAKQMAVNPATRLTGRAAGRVLIQYSGGALTLGEILDYIHTESEQYRQQVINASADVITEQVLMPLVQRELLLRAAQGRGLAIPIEVQDSLGQLARDNFITVARFLNLLNIPTAEGQTVEAAIEARVNAVISQVLDGSQQAIPMAGVSYTLRQQFPYDVLESGIGMTVERVGEARGPAPTLSPAPPPSLPPTTDEGVPAVPVQGVPPDTTGGS